MSRPTAHQVTARLREVGALADLEPAHRLHAKIDMTPHGITRRLRDVSELLRLCVHLRRFAATTAEVRTVAPAADV